MIPWPWYHGHWLNDLLTLIPWSLTEWSLDLDIRVIEWSLDLHTGHWLGDLLTLIPGSLIHWIRILTSWTRNHYSFLSIKFTELSHLFISCLYSINYSLYKCISHLMIKKASYLHTCKYVQIRADTYNLQIRADTYKYVQIRKSWNSFLTAL